MAKMGDLVVCEQCRRLMALRDVQINLVKPRTVLQNQIVCNACARKKLEEQEGA
jgi:hypothetical protein